MSSAATVMRLVEDLASTLRTFAIEQIREWKEISHPAVVAAFTKLDMEGYRDAVSRSQAENIAAFDKVYLEWADFLINFKLMGTVDSHATTVQKFAALKSVLRRPYEVGELELINMDNYRDLWSEVSTGGASFLRYNRDGNGTEYIKLLRRLSDENTLILSQLTAQGKAISSLSSSLRDTVATLAAEVESARRDAADVASKNADAILDVINKVTDATLKAALLADFKTFWTDKVNDDTPVNQMEAIADNCIKAFGETCLGYLNALNETRIGYVQSPPVASGGRSSM